MRSTGAAIDNSSSANMLTSAAGGLAKARERALAARTGGGTWARIACNRAIASAEAGTRPRPIRSTNCRQADCAPKGEETSAANTVSRLSSKRKSASPARPWEPRRKYFLTVSVGQSNASFRHVAMWDNCVSS
jgi:hypothetical protein